MNQAFIDLKLIFSRTKEDIESFSSMLQPVVDGAQDEHERLYFHHILEEEEQRLERLEVLLPMLQQAIEEDLSSLQFIQLLQELNLEKFGLHNFREHLDLAMFEFKDEERQAHLKTMRERTQNDYLKVKDLLPNLSNQFQEPRQSTVVSTSAVQQQNESKTPFKRLTVGSLKK